MYLQLSELLCGSEGCNMVKASQKAAVAGVGTLADGDQLTVARVPLAGDGV